MSLDRYNSLRVSHIWNVESDASDAKWMHEVIVLNIVYVNCHWHCLRSKLFSILKQGWKSYDTMQSIKNKEVNIIISSYYYIYLYYYYNFVIHK